MGSRPRPAPDGNLSVAASKPGAKVKMFWNSRSWGDRQHVLGQVRVWVLGAESSESASALTCMSSGKPTTKIVLITSSSASLSLSPRSSSLSRLRLSRTSPCADGGRGPLPMIAC